MHVETLKITNLRPEHAAALAVIQKLAFPNLSTSEHLTEAQFRNHIKVFPEGQFVVLHGDQPVGSTSTLIINFDFKNPAHKYLDIIDHGWLGNHNPRGEWLYGADISVHPDFRRMGIARKLYAAREALVEKLGLRGQLAAGMIPGYHRYAHRYTLEAYCAKVASGQLSDPTLSAQLKVGFRYVQVIYDYLHDETSGNAAALIVWENDKLKSKRGYDQPTRRTHHF